MKLLKRIEMISLFVKSETLIERESNESIKCQKTRGRERIVEREKRVGESVVAMRASKTNVRTQISFF